MACLPPKPRPTEFRLPLWADEHRMEEYRNVHCRLYAGCIDEAIRKDWEGFTCRKCPLFHDDPAPRAEEHAFDQPTGHERP